MNSISPQKSPLSAPGARRFFLTAVFRASGRVTSHPVRRSRQEGPAGAGGVPQCAAAAGALGAKARGVARPTMHRGAARAVRSAGCSGAFYVASFSPPFPSRPVPSRPVPWPPGRLRRGSPVSVPRGRERLPAAQRTDRRGGWDGLDRAEAKWPPGGHGADTASPPASGCRCGAPPGRAGPVQPPGCLRSAVRLRESK